MNKSGKQYEIKLTLDEIQTILGDMDDNRQNRDGGYEEQDKMRLLVMVKLISSSFEIAKQQRGVWLAGLMGEVTDLWKEGMAINDDLREQLEEMQQASTEGSEPEGDAGVKP